MSRPPESSDRILRVVRVVSGLMYLVVGGLLVFFRLGPFAKVAARFEDRGTPLPTWMTLGLSLGVALVVALFVWKAIRLFRPPEPGRYRRPGGF